MNAYSIAGKVSRWKKWKAHDVVPMHMGHEEIIDLRLPPSMLRQCLFAEAAQSRAHVAECVMIAATDFDTGGIAAVAAAHGKLQFRIDESVERRFVGEFTPIGLEQGAFDFVANGGSIAGCRQRAPRSPKTDAHGD